MDKDWTVGVDGLCNSSELFLSLVGIVDEIIRGSAHDLISGRSKVVAKVIVANLAHSYNVGPMDLKDEKNDDIKDLL